MNRTPLAAAVAVLLALAAVSGCGVGSNQPTPQATVTISVTPGSPSVDESSRAGAGDEAALALWGRAADLIEASADSGKPVVEQYSAIIRHASYDQAALGADKCLTLSVDKVKWNPQYYDGVGTPDPIINPEVKWETIYRPEALVLVMDQARPRGIRLEEFVRYVNEGGSGTDGFRMPFRFYFVGKTLVAVQEWYLP